MAADAEFTEMIAQTTSGLIVTEDQLDGGTISNISIQAVDTLVSAETSYVFTFTPVSSIDSSTQSKIEITLPSSISFVDDDCTIEAKSSYFSSAMSCNIDYTDDDQAYITLSYIFSNRPDFVGGSTLSVTLSSITNAAYVGDIG